MIINKLRGKYIEGLNRYLDTKERLLYEYIDLGCKIVRIIYLQKSALISLRGRI